MDEVPPAVVEAVVEPGAGGALVGYLIVDVGHLLAEAELAGGESAVAETDAPAGAAPAHIAASPAARINRIIEALLPDATASLTARPAGSSDQ